MTIIRIITGCRRRGSYRDLFLNLKILPLQSQYILSHLLFVVKKIKFWHPSQILDNLHHICYNIKTLSNNPNNLNQP